MFNIVSQRGGIVSVRELPRRNMLVFYEQPTEGEQVNVRQGVYAIPRALVSTMVDVEKLVPNGIVCLYNAWAFYKLSIAIPPAICIAIETKRKVSIPKGYMSKKCHNLSEDLIDV